MSVCAKRAYTADERPIGMPVDMSGQRTRGGEHDLVVESVAGRTPPVDVPEQAVRAVEPDRVVLEATTDEIVRPGWNKPPSAFRYH